MTWSARITGSLGLISQEEYDYVCYKEKAIAEEIERLKSVKIGAAAANQEYLASIGSAPLKTACSLAELLCRPELSYEKLAPLDPDRKDLPEAVREQVEINIRYEGYIQRQKKQVSQFEKLENKRIPAGIDYDQVESLRLEARQKLKEFMPSSIGQASRISGVTPADVSVLPEGIHAFFHRAGLQDIRGHTGGRIRPADLSGKDQRKKIR